MAVINQIRKFSFLVLILLLSIGVNAKTYPLHAFKNYGSSSAQKMEIIGQVTARSNMITDNRPRVMDYDTREMILSAKLYEESGVRIGDTVYIIQKDPDHRRYKNGLIVGQATVYSVFKTEFQGWMIKAKGNLSMVKKGHFIARLDFGSERELALEYLKKGDKYNALNDYTNAFYWYRKSLEKDSNRAEIYMRLAQLSKKQGFPEQALTYIEEAWHRGNRIEDPNDAILLPRLYLDEKLNALSDISDSQKRLKQSLKILHDLRKYLSGIDWIRGYMSPAMGDMIVRKGLPDYIFQYRMGELYDSIYKIIDFDSGNSMNTVLGWLEPPEREILFAEITLPYRKDPIESPKKSWESAYFEAALYHYMMANELNELDTRSAYSIIELCAAKLGRNATQIEKKRYKSLVEHYSRVFLRVPDDSIRYSRVRSIVTRLDQY